MADREILASLPGVELGDVASIFIQSVERSGMMGIVRVKFLDGEGRPILFVRCYSNYPGPPVVEILPEIKEG